MGFAVSGNTTVAATTAQSIYFLSYGGTMAIQASATYLVTGLTTGSNTFTAEYEAGSGTCTYANRSIMVTP
jgi:hypothetical protein